MLTLLYDGSCALCCFEIHFLQERNTQNNLKFVDITDKDFKEKEWDVKYEDLMSVIHARTSDGNYIKGMDVFVASYQAVGLHRITNVVQAKSLRFIFDKAYYYFAQHRKFFSKICSPFIKCVFNFKARRALKNSQRCKKGYCEIL